MLIIHHLGVSQSERIVWLCEELGLPYQLQHYERDAKSRLAPPEYRALHPMGIAPVINDGAVTLAESGAIIEYLLAKYGQGRLVVAPDQPNFADYLFWLHFANGTLMPAEMSGLMAARLGLQADSPTMKGLMSRGERGFAMVEQRLGESAYFAGAQFTAADVIMLFPLTTMRAFSRRDLAAYPNIRAYLQRIGARPAYRRAMAAGDPGMEPMLA
ncbi:glutathione S-transferase family protein [Hydrocarboniphaga sp.]|uniref:glutathione S-transferase family protein n=1 Tax=Hydrocarboniphaga sp. TaxID=2033016 RepID=UPI003D0D9122